MGQYLNFRPFEFLDVSLCPLWTFLTCLFMFLFAPKLFLHSGHSIFNAFSIGGDLWKNLVFLYMYLSCTSKDQAVTCEFVSCDGQGRLWNRFCTCNDHRNNLCLLDSNYEFFGAAKVCLSFANTCHIWFVSLSVLRGQFSCAEELRLLRLKYGIQCTSFFGFYGGRYPY